MCKNFTNERHIYGLGKNNLQKFFEIEVYQELQNCRLTLLANQIGLKS